MPRLYRRCGHGAINAVALKICNYYIVRMKNFQGKNELKQKGFAITRKLFASPKRLPQNKIYACPVNSRSCSCQQNHSIKFERFNRVLSDATLLKVQIIPRPWPLPRQRARLCRSRLQDREARRLSSAQKRFPLRRPQRKGQALLPARLC